jgi:DnaJ family protein C protein 11
MLLNTRGSQMRAEYEKQARLKKEQELENLVRSKGEFQINLNASQVFDPYDPPVLHGFGQAKKPRHKSPFDVLARAQVQQLFMKHSFEVRHAHEHACRLLQPGS